MASESWQSWKPCVSYRCYSDCSQKEPSVGTPPIPIVLLTGFLGAGKTTVLEQLLKGDHGKKLGVIVNDLAAVNVDANVLDGAIEEAGARSVSLENGCVCCSASDDLQISVHELLSTQDDVQLDAIIVELSGVAEPARARATLDHYASGRPDLSRELIVRTVAIVDSPSFADDYMNVQHGSPVREGNERIGTLLAEQLENANLVLLNKADIATEQELHQAQALTHGLNSTAEVRVTEHGSVEPSMLWAPSNIECGKHEGHVKDSQGHGQEHGHAHEHAHAHSHTHGHDHAHDHDGTCSDVHDPRSLAEKRFGITSFVYRTDTPLSRQRLVRELKCWSKARASLSNKLHLEGLQDITAADDGSADWTPLLPILRSKGTVCMDGKPPIPYNWSHAGRSMNLSMWMPGAQWDGSVPSTELVFIGSGYDEAAIRSLLDSCMLTNDELAVLNTR